MAAAEERAIEIDGRRYAWHAVGAGPRLILVNGYGGTGSDRIYAKDGKADTNDCGRGRDTVVTRDKADTFTSCEKVPRSAA